jgi:osmotically-inducible protein OsmY
MCDSVPTAADYLLKLLSGFYYLLKKPFITTIWRITMTKLNKYASAVFLATAVTFTLATAVGCSSTPTTEGTGQYIDDSIITAKVKAALIENDLTKATEINVETFKGIVQLSGFVSSQASANKAIELARNVGGVKGVTNDMRLK